MSTERLDRIETILEQAAQTAQANTAAIEANRVAIAQLNSNIAELNSTVNSLVQIVEVHQRNHEVSQRNFEVIVNQIRGLQTENQRILEHLFGREQNGG